MNRLSIVERPRTASRLPSTPVLVFAVVSLCVALLGWLLHERAKTLIGHQAEAYLTAVADLKAFEIASWHRDRLDDAEVIAATPYTRSRIREFLEDARQGPTADEMRQYLAARLESKRYMDGLLVDAKGEVRLSVGFEEPGLDAEGRADVMAVLESGRPMVTDLHRSEATGRVHLAIMAPVPGSPAADGSPRRGGVVVFRVDPDVFLYPLIESWPTPSATSETFLCRQEADEVVFLNELRHRKGTALTLRFAVASPVLPAAMVVRGQEGVIRGLDYRGVPVRAVGRRIPDTPWYLVAKTDEAEILRPVHLWVWLIVACASCVVVGTGLSFLLWSARRDARRLLRQREADEAAHVQAQIIDQVPGPLIATDLEGTITSWNRGAEIAFGYTADEAIGRSGALIYPDSPVSQREELVRGPLLGRGTHEVDVVLRRKSGEEFPGHLSMSLVRDPDGKPVGMVGHTFDLTQRVRVEEELRQERDRFESLFETAPLARLTLDRGGRVGMWNAAAEALFGWTAEEAIGQVLLAIPEAERERVLTVLGENLMGGTLSNIELTLQRKDGTPIDVALWSTPVRGSGGEVTGITAIVADIRARRLAEEEARRLTDELEKQVAERTAELSAANEELQAFAYSVSHDLRAPLRGIDGWSVALLEDCWAQLGEQGQGYLQRVRQEAARMGELIDNLLLLSRVTRSEMQRTGVDMSALASKVLERLRSSDPDRQVEVAVEPGLVADGDPKLLEIALTNLIGNAWKFTSKHSSARIQFGAIGANGERAYYVRDDGVGFDMANAQRLFSPFHRMHRVSEYPGTGIGLATVQRVVHRHGGRVWAEAAVGQGATFYFTLKGA